MANAFDTYTTTGPPERAHVRRAAVWDLGLVTIVFMILWPMPALRLTAGLPWSVHVPILLASLFVVWWLYAAVCARPAAHSRHVPGGRGVRGSRVGDDSERDPVGARLDRCASADGVRCRRPRGRGARLGGATVGVEAGLNERVTGPEGGATVPLSPC